MKQIYLTIDDAPSENMDLLLDYLIAKKRFAVFFCRGDALEKNTEPVVRAIGNGFMVGNHSYDHPHFSKISFEEGRRQVLRTEGAIEKTYEKAGANRPGKYFRFPYGDFGGKNTGKYQRFLKEQGFSVPRLKTGKEFFDERRHDWFWTIDSEDWKLGCALEMGFTFGDIMKNLKPIQNNAVVLVHDHSQTTDFFFKICEAIARKGFSFGRLPAKQ